MNLIIYEVKRHWKSFCAFLIGIAVFNLMALSKFASITETTEMSNKLIETMPKAMQIIFGFYNVDIATISGYSATMYIYYALILCIYAAFLGSYMIIREKVEKTEDYIYTLPIKRHHLYRNKTIAGIIILLIVLITTMFSMTITTILFANNTDLTFLLNIGLYIAIQMYLFYALGIAIATKITNKSATSIAIVTVFFLYIFASIVQIADINFLTYFSPFSIYTPEKVIHNSAPALFTIILLFLSTILIFSAINFNADKEVL